MISVPVDLVLKTLNRITPRIMNVYVTISVKEVHVEAFDIGVKPPSGWLHIGIYDGFNHTFTQFMHDPETHKKGVAA